MNIIIILIIQSHLHSFEFNNIDKDTLLQEIEEVFTVVAAPLDDEQMAVSTLKCYPFPASTWLSPPLT